MSTLKTIANITSIYNLANFQRPVFALGFEDNTQLVIKKENVQNAQDNTNLKYNLKVMKVASPDAGGSVLDPLEMLQIQSFIDDAEFIANATFKPVNQHITYLKSSMQLGGVWFKMKKAEGIINLESAVQSLQANDKTGVRAIAEALNAPGGFEALGKIVAIDLFNNNDDRFSAAGIGGQNPRTNTTLRALANVGNVLLAVQNGQLSPIGLDSYDSATGFRDVSQTITAIETGYYQNTATWAGRMLAKGQVQARFDFAKKIVEDLEDVLGPRNRKIVFANKKRLADNAAERITLGMMQAISDLKKKLGDLVKKPNAPIGIADRLAIIS